MYYITYIWLQSCKAFFSYMCANVRLGQQRPISHFLAVKPTAFQIEWIHVLLRRDLQLKPNPDLQSLHTVSRLWLIPYNEENKHKYVSVCLYICFTLLHWLICFLLFIFVLFFEWKKSLICVTLQHSFNNDHVSRADWLFNK